MTTYLLFKSKSGHYFCTPDNLAQQKASDNPKDPSYYVMSFECNDVEKAFETFQVFSTEPEIFSMTHQQLMLEVRKLREGIRKHRDSSKMDLCWYHPELWNLLPEKIDPNPIIPETKEFLKCCAEYRKSLDPLEAEQITAKETEEIHRLSEEARAEDADNYLLVKEDE